MEQSKMVRVVATGRGYDGLVVREAGEEFDMPESAFAQRPMKDKEGKAIPGEFYDAPSWFVRKKEVQKEAPVATAKGASKSGDGLV